ncbi:MAG: PAS domain S-box protein, partial [Candidatus Methylomirabilales bacterium]
MSGQSLTVLLIEDNPGDARLIRETLADAKDVPYNLECADRLSTGLARLVARGIDVVLLDLSLPDSHGLETFVKTQTQAPELPIIILTGLDDETLALEAVRKGAQDYLVKGQVDTHLLVRATRHAVERKRAEKALRWLEKAVETMELGVTITDTDGRIVYINSADASMHGHTVEDLIGKDVRILAPSELGEPMTVDQTQKVDTWRRQSVNIRKDGTTFPVQLISRAVTNAAGEPIGIATICEDITERKRVEEELEAAQLQLIQSAKLESVGRLAAGVAHEVKNPLSIILMGVNY